MRRRAANKPPALPNRPWIGVHTLAEFRFCGRAGYLAFHKHEEDSGSEIERQSLRERPLLRKIEVCREFDKAFRLFVYMAGTLIVAFAAIGISRFSGIASLNYAWLVVATLVIPILLDSVWKCIRLGALYWSIDNASAREPDCSTDIDERINWWQLANAGYEKAAYQEKLVDESLGLVGCPKICLRRGREVVPVFRRSGSDRIRPQQRLRIMAYCHLIALSEGAIVRFGVILDSKGYRATVVKFRDGENEIRKQLHRARLILEEATSDPMLRRFPQHPSLCHGCPHGRPQQTEKGDTETILDGRVLEFHPLFNRAGTRFNCACGDRFKWRPPHKHSADLTE